MKVKIMQRSVYHKYAEIEIDVPNKIYKDYIKENGSNKNGEPYHDLQDYLLDNENDWTDDIDHQINNSEFVFGSGLYDIKGMEDAEADSELRYECKELKIGGHL